MKRFTIILLAIALLLGGTTWASNTGLVYHGIQVKDETGENVTTISSVSIYAPDSTTNAVIYSDRALATTITVPITAASANSTLSDGYFFWWGPDGYDFSMTDGNNIATNANHRTRTASEGTLVFPSYLQSISTLTYTDAQSATFGDSSDWVLSAGAVADTFTAIPATTSTSTFNIGSASYTSDFRLFGDSGYHVIWDASAYLFELQDSAIFAVGTGSDYTITHTGGTTTAAGALTNSGIHTFSTDILLDGTYDISYDDDRYQLLFEDDAVLGIGGAHDAAGDVTFTHDGADLYMDAAIASEGWLIGDTTSGFDIALRFQTAGEFRTDYDADFINLTDDMDMRYGTGASSDGDFMISGDSAPLLTIDVVVAGDGEVAVGNDADDVPLKWYAEDTGDWVYFNALEVEFEDVVLQMMDDTPIHIGDGDDATIQYDEDNLDALQFTGFVFGQKKLVRTVAAFPATEATVLATQTGIVIVGTYTFDGTETPTDVGGTQTFFLPAAAAGLTYTFIDISAVATGTVEITAYADEDIVYPGESATRTIISDDALSGGTLSSVTLTATGTGAWYTTAHAGTWTAF